MGLSLYIFKHMEFVSEEYIQTLTIKCPINGTQRYPQIYFTNHFVINIYFMFLYKKVLSHCVHLYGFSPVCTIVWSIRYCFHVRTWWQLRFFTIKINNTL